MNELTEHYELGHRALYAIYDENDYDHDTAGEAAWSRRQYIEDRADEAAERATDSARA